MKRVLAVVVACLALVVWGLVEMFGALGWNDS